MSNEVKVGKKIQKLFFKADVNDGMADKCAKHKRYRRAHKYQTKSSEFKKKAWFAVKEGHAQELDFTRALRFVPHSNTIVEFGEE